MDRKAGSRTTLFFALLVCQATVPAQSIELSGTVSIQNSRYETGERVHVTDASVRAPFAKAVSSDRNGVFKLQFSGVAPGAPIRISVEKPGLEVVNRSDLDAFVLGGGPLEVVMADPARLAEAQERFYRVSAEQVSRKFEERMRDLQDERIALSERMKVVNALLLDSLATLGEAQEALALQRETALQQVQDLARILSLVDLDRSNDHYRSAYQAMQRGAVDSVLTILGVDVLDRDLAAARSQREKGVLSIERANTGIRQVFSAYGLKADVLRLSLDLRSALEVLARMDTIQRAQVDAFTLMDRALFLRELGRMQVRLARLPEANASLDSSWSLLRNRYGPDHPEAVQTMLEIAALREEEGRLEEAMTLYREALSYRERSVDANGSGLIEPWAGIGNVLSAMGAYDSALICTERALTIVQETGLAGTMEEAVLTNSLGFRLDYLGRYQEAHDVYQRSLAQRKRLIAKGTKGVDLTVVYGNLGYVCDEMGDYTRALQYHDSCLVLEERLYGRRHTAPAGTINNIGRVRSRMGDDEGALSDYQEAYAIRRSLLGPDHFTVGVSHNNIASKLDDLGRRNEALPHYEEALRIFTTELGPDHPFVGTVLANKAGSLGDRGDHEEAMAAYRESLRIGMLAHGNDHDAVALALSGIGVQWIALGSADSALHYLLRAREIQSATLGPDHPDIGYTEESLGNANLLKGDTTQARAHFERSIAIAERPGGRPDPVLAPRKASLARCLLAAGEREQAAATAREARSIAPDQHASWILYLLATDDAGALEHLIECMEARGTTADEGRVDKEELEKAFKTVATRMKREDLIRRYDP